MFAYKSGSDNSTNNVYNSTYLRNYADIRIHVKQQLQSAYQLIVSMLLATEVKSFFNHLW